MAYIILLIFIFSCIFAFIEDRVEKKYQYWIYLFFGICLVLISGLREIGIDPDSENYAVTYRNYYSESAAEGVEFTYIYLAAFLNIFTNDPHALFLIYALFGVGIKMFAFHRYNDKHIFLFLIMYLSYYYVVHDVMQIRTGILSGMLLLSVYEITNGRRLVALGYLLIGSMFHVSGLILLPILFLSTKPLTIKGKIFWTSIVLFSLFLSASGGNIFDYIAQIPYIGNKMEIYRKAAEMGQSHSTINGFGFFHLISIAIYLYLMFFSNVITEEDKHFPLMIRIASCGLAFYTILGFIPDLGARVSFLYRTVTIILFADIIYTIKPRWCGILFAELVAALYLNYGVQFIQFTLFWKTGGA